MGLIETPEQVQEVFDITLTGNQYIMMLNYFQNGIIPYDGCPVCDAAFVRELIGKVLIYNAGSGV